MTTFQREVMTQVIAGVTAGLVVWWLVERTRR